MAIKTIDKGRSHLRELLVDGEVASWLTIIDYRMRVGTAQVKIGGIASVATKQEHRGKGYMRTLMEESIRYMKKNGYDASLVLGIPDFYYRFGYLSCMPLYLLTIPVKFAREIKAARKKYRIRKFEPKDDAALLGIYHDNNKLRSCSLIREKGYFRASPRKYQEVFVVEHKKKRVAAYFIAKKSAADVLILEMGTKDEDVFTELLAKFTRLAVRRKARKIDFLIPPDFSFVNFCKKFDCRFITEFHKNRGVLLRIINQASLFRKLEGELNRRLSSARFRNVSGSLTIKTDIGDSTLRINNGVLKICAGEKEKAFLRLSQGQLAQLLIGYRTVSDVFLDSNVRAGRGVKPLAEALFPPGIPYMWDKSRFENPRLLPEDYEGPTGRAPVYESQFPVDI